MAAIELLSSRTLSGSMVIRWLPGSGGWIWSSGIREAFGGRAGRLWALVGGLAFVGAGLLDGVGVEGEGGEEDGAVLAEFDSDVEGSAIDVGGEPLSRDGDGVAASELDAGSDSGGGVISGSFCSGIYYRGGRNDTFL